MAKSLDDLTRKISELNKWKLGIEENFYTLLVPQIDGRKQLVRLVEFEYLGQKLIRFTTKVGNKSDLTKSRFEKALEVNAHLPYGCLAIDGEEFVITDTRPLLTTTPETSGEVIKHITKQADFYEKLIFKKDVY